MNINKQLLCVFSQRDSYKDTIEYIKSKYSIVDGKIFVFANENTDDVYLTFNVLKSKTLVRCKGAIGIHRKKQTNTLYTLNALNRLIADENDGVYDKTHQLNWNLYKNSLILTNDIGVKITALKLISIVTT